jgi:hypothetical protein
MLKTINILLVFLFTSVIFGKNTGDEFKLIYPKFIPQNSSFEISLVTNNLYPSADRLELYIMTGQKAGISKIEFRSLEETRKLNYSTVYPEQIQEQAVKTEIEFKDSGISSYTFFQVVFTVKPESNSPAIFKLLGIFKNKDKILGYLSSGSEEENIISIPINYFKPQKNAGKAAQITKQSVIDAVPVNVNSENLLTEFWIKPCDSDISILNIYNKKNQGIKLELALNEFQMFTVNSEIYVEYLAPLFGSRKTWSHIEIFYSDIKKKLYFYCNSIQFAKCDAEAFNLPGDIGFKFSVNEQGKSYQMDLLRIIDFNNVLDVAAANKTFVNFKSDSSLVLCQLNFDQQDILPDGYYEIEKSSLQLVKSDAPIMARAPELNITLLNNAYELEWSGGDYQQAATYILEKSGKNGIYSPVFTIQADNSSERTYSYLDGKDKASEVLYYRVKQNNSDGSVVYSSQVKVGQGETESFTLRQNYPNPFNPKTSIDVELLEDTDIEVIIYNLEGEELDRLYNGFLTKGLHKFEFNAKEFPSGVYIYKVSTPRFSVSKKMILTK